MDHILNSLEIAITLSVHTHARIHWQLEVLMFEQATRTTESFILLSTILWCRTLSWAIKQQKLT
jgi:hypothetical protein